jgi:hypothetical protein
LSTFGRAAIIFAIELDVVAEQFSTFVGDSDLSAVA